MKKRFLAILLVFAVIASAFSACSQVGNLEKDVQVYLQTESSLEGPYTVNSFNNAVVPVPEAPKGKTFLGWTDDADWQNKDLSEISISANRGLIRFDDVKKYADKGSVTLYPVFGVKARHDLAVAWYAKEATSGLNQSVMDTFTSELKAYLTENGHNPDEMDIVVRAYDGNVGTTCGNIMQDADVDIMIGWAAKSNIEDTGGMKAGEDFLANYGNITLTGAAKARYAARLSDSELVKNVYDWILATYAGEGGAKKDYDVTDTPVTPDPTPDPEPKPETIVITDKVLTVSVWNKNWTWITKDQLELLKTDFNAYLTEHGVNVSELTINWIEETATKVADLIASVNSNETTVDFVLACGNNINSEGNMTNLEKELVTTSKYMAENRYIAVLHKDEPRQLATILYEFMTGKDFPSETPDPTPDPEPDPDPKPETIVITDKVLTVSVWNNNWSWITKDQLELLKTDFNAYLTEHGVNVSELTINWIEETATAVADLGTSVNNSETTVDFVLACGANIETKGKVTNLVKEQIPESKYMAENRYIAVLHKDEPRQLATILYEFMTGKDFPSETPDPTPDPEPDPDPKPETIVITDKVLTVSVWNNNWSWITKDQLELLKTDFNAYLTEHGVNVSELTINWIEETATAVADLGTSVNNSETTVDFVLACGANIETKGKVTNLVKEQIPESKYMTAGRYVAVLHKDEPRQLATILYEFMTGNKFVTETTDGGAN